jgi:enamine deaminase RidA (YjgF/YER057c/UK114 family)
MLTTLSPAPGVTLAQRRHGDHLWLTAQGDDLAACRHAIHRVLAEVGAWTLQERIIADQSTWNAVTDTADACDVQPVLLAPPPGYHSQPAVLVHAFIASQPPGIVRLDDTPLARRWREQDGSEHLAIGGLLAYDPTTTPNLQARTVFANLGRLLNATDSAWANIARTWIWMDDILAWYPAFNRVRNDVFRTVGLVQANGGAAYLPASTGIGVVPSRGRIAIEALATLRGAPARMSEAAGNQQSAFLYGSAFSRATRLDLGGAAHLFVSGTAAIDYDGYTVAVGDPMGQACHTLANTQAVLADRGLTNEDVLQATIYCATPDAADAWYAIAPDWPSVVVAADVCRGDLLIEAEVVARTP